MKHRYIVYVLLSRKDSDLYIGITQNLKQRLNQHNSKLVFATKSRTPLEVVYYEVFFNRYDASLREKYLKTGWGRKHLRKALKTTLKERACT